ncbi:hypothetical protein MMC28_010737 [Mycoblastus sanguinarius]|nr:hypothetical protein [Mycoblastus sanguinarius]
MHRPRRNANEGEGKAVPPLQQSRFLKLALELRENIYTHVLQEASSSLDNLLLVNRQTSTEIKPFLFKRPLTFDGQLELFHWLDNVDHQYLCHVIDVRFKLHDIDPNQIVGALGKRLQQANITRASGSRGSDTPDNPYFQACSQDLRRVAEAFCQLPNIKNLTILSCTDRDPQPHERTLTAFSKFIGQRFPGLRTLTSEVNMLPIDFIASKPNLRQLRYPAIAENDDEEVAEVFSNLPDVELQICRRPPHTASGADDWGHMTAILENMKPLRSLTLFEEAGAEDPNLATEVFMGSATSLERHKDSLRTLRLLAEPRSPYSANGLVASAIDRVSKFLAQSHLTYIEYLDSYCPVYRYLPSTAHTVVWRLDRPPAVRNTSLAMRIKALVACAVQFSTNVHKLPNLKHIVIYVDRRFQQQTCDNDDEDTPSPEHSLEWAQWRLGRISIKVSWKVWDSKDGL